MLNIKASRYDIKDYAYYLLLFSLPLSTFAPNLMLGILVVITIVQGQIDWRSFLSCSLVLFVVYNFLNGFFSGAFPSEHQLYIRLLPLVLIPFSFSKMSRTTVERGYLFLFMSVFVVQMIAFYGIVEYYYFTDGKKVALRSYAGINDILRFERPYLGFLSAIQIIIGCDLLAKKRKWFYLVPMLVSLTTIIIISARLAILIAVICSTAYIFLTIKNKIIKWTIAVGIPVIAVSMLMVSNTALKHRFIQIKHDSRNIIWKGGFFQFQSLENKFFGLASQKAIDERQNEYYQNEVNFEYPPDKERFVTKNYNMHNQYLNELVRGGYVGLILLLGPIVFLLLTLDYKTHMLSFSLVLSIIMFLLVENVLERQLGVYLVGIILANAVSKKN